MNQPELRDHLVAAYDSLGEFADRITHAIDTATSYVESDDVDAEEFGQDPYDAANEYPLSIETTQRVTIVLGTGGPHTELVADLDSGGDMTALAFHGYWGSESVERRISSTHPIWSLARMYVEQATEQY